MLDLAPLFEALPALPGGADGTEIMARRIPSLPRHRVARMPDGSPALLLAVSDTGRGRPAPIALEHLTVQHDSSCRLRAAGGAIEEGVFTVVACTGADRILRGYFLRVVGTALMALGPQPARREVAHAVEGLVELFRSLSLPPRKSVQGLWAELLLIAQSRSPALMVRAWHAAPTDRYDFNLGSERLEVKSAAGRIRQHHFTLEQLQPPEGTLLLVASLLAERAGGGTSLRELVDEIRSRLAGDASLLLKLDRVIVQTLGEGLRLAWDERFDRQLARASLVFYQASDIPAVDPSVPAQVSDVRFRVSLDGIAASPLQQGEAAPGGLLEAARA